MLRSRLLSVTAAVALPALLLPAAAVQQAPSITFVSPADGLLESGPDNKIEPSLPAATDPRLRTGSEVPTLKIISPKDGAALTGDSASVAVTVSNFELVAAGGPLEEGYGHLHFFLDAALPTDPDQPAVTAPGTYQMTTTLSATWEDLEPGTHTLGVMLVENDHSPLAESVADSITIAVPPPPAREPEPEATEPSAAPVNWWLIGGVAAAGIMLIGIAALLAGRRPSAAR